MCGCEGGRAISLGGNLCTYWLEVAHQRVCVGMKNGEFHVLAPFSFELLMKVLILPNSVINYKLEGAWLLLKK